ncbi:hypothetical protein FQN49_001787 [Arthroderma sp. PD_2]|nr:hypothetical protein FQN49_001787 [Arthroderma sp. PD_2]
MTQSAPEDGEERKGDEDGDVQEEEADFDPTICAKLYNRLIRTCFRASNREQKGESLRTNWFEVWRTDPKVSKIRDRLPQPMVEFLEQIQIVVGSDGSAHFHDVLIYHLKSILSPTSIDDDLMLGGPLNDGIDCICLFPTNFGSIPHRLGVVMDLDDFTVRYLPSIFDYVDRDYGWYPLQDVLFNFNAIVEIGKYVPASFDWDVNNEWQPTIGGWKAVPWTDFILDETLAAYEKLVDAIVARLPDHSPLHQRKPIVSEDKIPPSIGGFTRGFLLRALRPPFRYIAPGLSIYDPDAPPLEIPMKRDKDGVMLYDTPYKEMYGSVHHDPLILFPAEEPAREELAGLWILPEQDWADSICLVLPYELKKLPTADGYKNARPTRCGLYQGPVCPFFGDHRTGLKTLLVFWKELVEKGVWTVGAEGIEGGIEGGIEFYRQAEDGKNGDWFDVGYCFEFESDLEINLDD